MNREEGGLVDSDWVIAIETGIILSRPWPPAGVPDTPATRAMRDEIAAQIAGMPPGVIPEVPAEWPAP